MISFLLQVELINKTQVDADLSSPQAVWEPCTASSPTSVLTSLSLCLLPFVTHLTYSTGPGTQQGCKNAQLMRDTLDSFQGD